tara:strand:+ start:87 stop:338 length:252 start_codon:yes stop_codon:yes gene_type:complete
MVTGLYLITVATWFHLQAYSDSDQVTSCLKQKVKVEERFKVNAVCFTKSDNVLMLDNETYSITPKHITQINTRKINTWHSNLE